MYLDVVRFSGTNQSVVCAQDCYTAVLLAARHVSSVPPFVRLSVCC